MPQPNAQSLANLDKIAEKIGKRLQQRPIVDIWKGTNGYSCDEAGNVTGLNLDECKITDISFLTDFPRLTHLSLFNNQVTDLSPLQALTKLNVLDLRSNQIADLSPLKALTQLKELRLESNQISDLSPLKALTQLTWLNLENNQVADLSPLQALTKLTDLSLYNNKIIDLSPLQALTKLTRLWLQTNHITNLSPLQALTQLNDFYIFGNPIEIPPPEIAKQGIDAIRNYFQEIEKQSVPLLQCKLLLVGAGAVGKTSLMKKLKNSRFKIKPGVEPTTRGVDIIPWELPCCIAGGRQKPVKLYAWDFGGQDIMYTTHQFFLTKRSLYIFVWEARLETQETDTFDYWLNIIKLLSAGSPVIIVMNKADVRTLNIDEASYQDKFKNIRAFFQVSCLTGNGLPELTEEIRRSLSAMKHLQDRLPKAWLDIRDALKNLNKDYISLDDYFDICKKHGLNHERADFLSDYLHDLGAILHFRNDQLLENTVILNPEWATHAVYRIMDEKSILENKGRFHYDKLKTLWDQKRFPADKHPQLLRLMERFELCFPVIGETGMHIVPELLPAGKPALDFAKYDRPAVLHFEYHYEFMPRGILSRFISRLYYYIHQDHFWKSGVELSLDGAYTLVLSAPLKRKLSVSVCGANKIELLTIARHHLEHIHRSLNMTVNEHYKEMIPCCCDFCLASQKPFLHAHQVLKRFVEKGVTFIQCQESAAEVPIDRLLRGFAPPPPKTDLKELFDMLITTVTQLQGRAKSIGNREDDRTSYIVDILTARGYIVKDQTRRGSSFSGKGPGELDMLIETPDGAAVSVVEALNLNYLDRADIARHFQKLFLYDASGLENNYLLVYVKSNDFINLWLNYLDYLPEIELTYKISSGPVEEKTHCAGIKIARTLHNRHNKETTVYHIFINMMI